jgi:microcystin-dependent protein
MPTNVRIASARYANAGNTLVFVLLDTGETWFVVPNNGSGQANVLAAWIAGGGNVGPYVPPVPGGVVPIGSLIWYASGRIPSGWLLCDGTQVKRKQYPKLFSAIGVTFGAGNGSTTFNLPDLRGKFVRGWGPVNPLDPDRAFGSVQENLLGVHRHSITDPGHTHGVTDPGHIHAVNDPGHTHVGDDPGHTHTVTDPNHNHISWMYEIGYLGVSVASNPTTVAPDPNYSPKYSTFNFDFETASANLSVNAGSANLLTGIGEANVSDLVNFTSITVNPATTNIIETDSQGGFETRPFNLSLLPYIRY